MQRNFGARNPLPRRAARLASRLPGTARATREKSRIHAGLRDDERARRAFVIARGLFALQKQKFARRAMGEYRLNAKHESLVRNFSEASPTIDARDDDRAHFDTSASGLRDPRATLARGVASDAGARRRSHHRTIGAAKNLPSVRNHLFDPNPRLAGKFVDLSRSAPQSRPSLPLTVVFAIMRCIDATPHRRAPRIARR